MSDDPSLFGDDEAHAETAQPVHEPAPIATWQIDLIRKALDVRGLSAITDRQQAVEDAVGRSVDSLRALTHAEAMTVLSRLGQASTSRRGSASSWDERDEDTWIDRL